MDIQLQWRPPVELVDGSRQRLIYTCHESALPEKPGIYVFARRHGNILAPLYIGQAGNLRRRIKQQFSLNLRLMKGIEAADAGGRVLLVGEISPRPGQQLKKVLDIVESAFIKAAQAQGHEILNKQGTRQPTHSITSSGNTAYRKFAERSIRLPSRR